MLCFESSETITRHTSSQVTHMAILYEDEARIDFSHIRVTINWPNCTRPKAPTRVNWTGAMSRIPAIRFFLFNYARSIKHIRYSMYNVHTCWWCGLRKRSKHCYAWCHHHLYPIFMYIYCLIQGFNNNHKLHVNMFIKYYTQYWWGHIIGQSFFLYFYCNETMFKMSWYINRYAKLTGRVKVAVKLIIYDCLKASRKCHCFWLHKHC